MASADGSAFASDSLVGGDHSLVGGDHSLVGDDHSLVGDDHSEVSRRLSDKILAAFNHAYAVGETATAKKLRKILVDQEADKGPSGDRRGNRGNQSPVAQADLWVSFVEARNRYNAISEDKRATQPRADKALAEMTDAYHQWTRI